MTKTKVLAISCILAVALVVVPISAVMSVPLLTSSYLPTESATTPAGTPSVANSQAVIQDAALGASSGTASQSLRDNFTIDSNLNSSLWIENGPLVGVLANRLSNVHLSMVSTGFEFSSEGLLISGVNTSYEMKAIQSIQTFTPPFTAKAYVMPVTAYGNAFSFLVTSSDGNHGVMISGDVNDLESNYYGVWQGYAPGMNQSWNPLAIRLIASPTPDTWYTLTIKVNSTGYAQVSAVSSTGQGLQGLTQLVGTGPFYVVLAQTEGAPYVVGPNSAYWGWVGVTGSRLSVPALSAFRYSLALEFAIACGVVALAVALAAILLRRRRRGPPQEVQLQKPSPRGVPPQPPKVVGHSVGLPGDAKVWVPWLTSQFNRLDDQSEPSTHVKTLLLMLAVNCLEWMASNSETDPNTGHYVYNGSQLYRQKLPLLREALPDVGEKKVKITEKSIRAHLEALEREGVVKGMVIVNSRGQTSIKKGNSRYYRLLAESTSKIEELVSSSLPSNSTG